jgi:CTP synthase
MADTKYIFVTGGVTSSLGKGIISVSLAKLLQARGYSITIQKLDPYINVDPGTLDPYEHGECYVTEDGAVTDLDLGHYERFSNVPTSQANNVTTGKIYQAVINKERKGEFFGSTVQVIPHITDEIKYRIKLLGNSGKYDIVITEIGGTVGDIESLPYIEAVRQMRRELGSNCLVIHLTLVPYLAAAEELKTKPTQHSVKTMLEQGVQPDIIVCRTERPLTNSLKSKIALFCNVDDSSVIESLDANTIYDVPLMMQKERLDLEVLRKLKMTSKHEPNLEGWEEFLHRIKNPTSEVTIGLIGKYVELKDAYKSIFESFIHAGAINNCKVRVKTVHSEHIEENGNGNLMEGFDGILVAPGFGPRGVEGKIIAVNYARLQRIPFFGICLGMQCAVIEFARNVLGLKKANSPELNIFTLQDWNSRQAYLVKSTSPQLLPMTGTLMLNRNISLNQGWNLVHIPTPQQIKISGIQSILNDDLIMIKPVADINLFWPQMGINSLTNLLPGKAYYFNVSKKVEFMFPDK